MTPDTVMGLFVFVVAAATGLEMGLSWLNLRELDRNADTTPPEFRDWIDDEAYRRSVRYTRARTRLGLLETLFDGAVLIVFAAAGGFAFFDRLAAPLAAWPIARGVAFFAMVGLLFSLLSIPFSLWSQFVIEERFGFNRMTWRLWALDLLKSLILGAALGLPVVAGLLWFMNAAGDAWWLWAAGFLLVVTVFMQILYPTLIAPWFNRFTPLDEGELRERVLALAARLGYDRARIHTMDASRRSRHANAYLAGLGRAKRIVLFDTLVDTLTPDEAEAVLAHELGHHKRGHIPMNLAISFLFQLAALYVLSLLMTWPAFHQAFGFPAPAPYRTLVVFAFASAPIAFFLTPLLAAWSRRFEYDADRFAVRTLGTGTGLADALRRLSRDNLTNLTPHPLHSGFHYSHPTLAERLKALKRFEAEWNRKAGRKPGDAGEAADG